MICLLSTFSVYTFTPFILRGWNNEASKSWILLQKYIKTLDFELKVNIGIFMPEVKNLL